MARDMTMTGPTKAAPTWTNDFLGPDRLVPGGSKLVATAFTGPDAAVAVVGVAGAAAGATSVPVAALANPIPSGTVLDFGTTKFARLTATAAAGATSLTVAALPTALVSGDTATYPGIKPRSVPSGTIVGRTIAERDAGTGFGPAAAADDDVQVLAFEVADVTRINDCELVRYGTSLKETFLPGWAGLASGVKDKVRARYVCMRGVE